MNKSRQILNSFIVLSQKIPKNNTRLHHIGCLKTAKRNYRSPRLTQHTTQITTDSHTSDFIRNAISSQSSKRNVTQNAKQPQTNLLAQHLAGEAFDIEEDEKESDDEYVPDYESDEEEDIKRAGVYRSKGITVYVPEKCMTPGTRRHKIKQLPKDMFDDIRIIFFK